MMTMTIAIIKIKTTAVQSGTKIHKDINEIFIAPKKNLYPGVSQILSKFH